MNRRTAMELYWREVRRGLNLVVRTPDGEEVRVGGVRETKRGIQAIAETQGYEPGRAANDLPSVEEAKRFVESFQPWQDFFIEPLELDPVVRAAEDG